MKRLPLYKQPPRSPLSDAAPEALDPSCEDCYVAACKPKIACMPPDGGAVTWRGGLLVVGDFPLKVEHRPFSGIIGRTVREAVSSSWEGPVVYDYAIKCAPGNGLGDKPKEKLLKKQSAIEQCRGYLRKVLDDAQPEIILAVGSIAATALLGRTPEMFSANKGYGWLDHDGRMIPVWLVSTTGVENNRFFQRRMKQTIQHALEAPRPSPDFAGTYTLVKGPKGARKAWKALKRAKWYTNDAETYGRQHNEDFRLESVAVLGDRDDNVWVWTRAALRDAKAADYLRRVLTSVPQVTANGKYDDQSYAVAFGTRPDVYPIQGDTRLMRKLLDSDVSAALASVAEQVGHGGHKHENEAVVAKIVSELKRVSAPPKPELTPTGRQRKPPAPPAFEIPEHTLQQLRIGVDPEAFAQGFVPAPILYRYNALDVWVTRAAYRVLRERLKQDPQLNRVWHNQIMPANRAVRRIEYVGIPFDRQQLQRTILFSEAKLADGRRRLLKAAGKEINVDSPKQVAELVYGTFKFPVIRETESGAPSCDADTLEKLKTVKGVSKTAVEMLDALMTCRKFSKILGTYGYGMLPHIRDDGRVHPSLLIDGAESGRLSSQAPNGQNLPRASTEEGKMVRDCFTSGGQEYALLELDQSQIELRVAALLSGDQVMIADFKAGIDIHAKNAEACCQLAWGISPEQWAKMTKDERAPFRTQIKTATFGRLYGKTAAGLAAEWGVSVKAVEKVLAFIWGRYKQLDAWLKRMEHESARTGYAETWWAGQPARKRPIFAIGSSEPRAVKHGKNQSGNTPIQGTAADFTTMSLALVVDMIDANEYDAELCLTVHDSLLIRIHKRDLHKVAQGIRAIMLGHDSGGVPLAVEGKVGPTWGTMEDYKFPEAEGGT